MRTKISSVIVLELWQKTYFAPGKILRNELGRLGPGTEPYCIALDPWHLD